MSGHLQKTGKSGIRLVSKSTQIIHMKNFLLLLMVIGVFSCSDQNGFTDADEQTIKEIRRNYINGWLANDSETVLGLFTEDATIVPSGLSPIKGVSEIEKYWFPNDSSITTIHSYEIELLELVGTDSIAYTLERGVLNFSYEKGDFSMSKESTSHATTVYKKNQEGKWKIISRMWTSLNQ